MHVFYVFATTHFNCQGGGILPYVREDISSKWFINLKISDEWKKKKKKKLEKKWLLCCSYDQQKAKIAHHLSVIGKLLDYYSSKSENQIFLEDLNSELNENSMEEFCLVYKLKKFVKTSTSDKNTDKPSCIDLLPTNWPKKI